MLRRIALVSLLLPATGAWAEGHAIGVKVGALGLGAEYTYDFTDRVSFRGGVYGSQLGFDAEEAGIDYEFDFVWDSLAAGVDFHPLKSALRLSLGILKNDNGLKATSRPNGNVTIGNTTYTPAEVGTLEAAVRFDDTATFAGVGWDWSRDKRLFGMSFDLGWLDQGRPRATLRGTGTLLGDPAFEQDIAAEERELADSVSDFDAVPYMSLGFLFRF
jgi:hypothetical protein